MFNLVNSRVNTPPQISTNPLELKNLFGTISPQISSSNISANIKQELLIARILFVIAKFSNSCLLKSPHICCKNYNVSPQNSYNSSNLVSQSSGNFEFLWIFQIKKALQEYECLYTTP